MPTTNENDYFNWLVDQVFVPPAKTFDALFALMHNTEFHWTIPNDDNRLQDGMDLRFEFLLGRTGSLKDLGGVTVLEILVSLSRKVAFTAGQSAKQWAWKLLKNLRLDKKNDPLSEADVEKVIHILDALIWRQYDYNGNGGFFPLERPSKDQTTVEIWYQMNQYVMERGML